MSVAYGYPAPMGGVGGMGSGPSQGSYPSMYGSFAFKKRFEQIDWKKIASADIDSISRNLDFHTLQDNIMNITFCNIEHEVDSRMIDPNFIKLFKLAQLTIEYLLHSQDYLSSMVGTLESKLRKAVEEHEETKKSLTQAKLDFSELKKEAHKRKKILIAQQQIMAAGPNSYNKCPFCQKAFLNITFLQSHVQRRHPEYASQYNSMVSSQMHYHSMPPQQVPAQEEKNEPSEKDQELERELGEIRERLRLTESQLVDERNARNKILQEEKDHEEEREREKRRESERQREEEERRHKVEFERMQKSVMHEMRELNEKYAAQSDLVTALQRKLTDAGDATNEHELDLLRQQRAENAMLKEQLQKQVKSMEDMSSQQNKQLENKIEVMEKQHKLQLEEMTDALEQSMADIDDKKQETAVRKEYEKKIQEANEMIQITDEKSSKMEADQKAMQIESQRARSQIPTRAPSAMDPPSEDELTTTMGTGTFRGTGSLSLSATRQAQLMDMIRKNPEFLKGMRQQLQSVFEDKLEKRGIPKNATGMTSHDFANKMSLLKQERLQKAQKLPNFWDIRQQYLNEVNVLAKRKMDEKRAHDRASGKGPQRNTPLSSSMPLSAVSRSASAPSPRKSPAPQRAAIVARHPGSSSNQHNAPLGANGRPLGQGIARFTGGAAAPKPAPRTPRGGANSGVRNSQEYSQADDTMASGQFSTTDEEDETESDDDETETASHYVDKNGNSASPRRQVVTKTVTSKKVVTKVPDDEEESDDDWGDDISGLDDLEPVSQPRTSTARQSPSPRGANVAKLTSSIERQLSGRQVKKPAGSVDTMEVRETRKQEVEFEDDDSLTSLSDEVSPPKPNARKPATRSSAQSDLSTNTYNTSAWGGSSKAASTVNPNQANPARGSVNKSLSKQSTSQDVSDNSNWDSDDGGHDDLDISELK